MCLNLGLDIILCVEVSVIVQRKAAYWHFSSTFDFIEGVGDCVESLEIVLSSVLSFGYPITRIPS